MLRESGPMVMRAVMAAAFADEERAETARREAVDALIAAFSAAAAEAETASSSGWYSLDRPGCVDCSGKGPAARAWRAAHPGASSAATRVPAHATSSVSYVAAPPSPPSVAPRPRALTAQAFASRLTWDGMEPIGVFAARMPAGVSGEPVGRAGNQRKFQYDFPGGGAIILFARPCERGRGLCVWAVDVE